LPGQLEANTFPRREKIAERGGADIGVTLGEKITWSGLDRVSVFTRCVISENWEDWSKNEKKEKKGLETTE